MANLCILCNLWFKTRTGPEIQLQHRFADTAYYRLLPLIERLLTLGNDSGIQESEASLASDCAGICGKRLAAVAYSSSDQFDLLTTGNPVGACGVLAGSGMTRQDCRIYTVPQRSGG